MPFAGRPASQFVSFTVRQCACKRPFAGVAEGLAIMSRARRTSREGQGAWVLRA
jgi:hypothetical protein